jgi:hypothetical protein
MKGKWARHVARIEKMKNTYKILAGGGQWKILPKRGLNRLIIVITIDFCEGVN